MYLSESTYLVLIQEIPIFETLKRIFFFSVSVFHATGRIGTFLPCFVHGAKQICNIQQTVCKKDAH